MTMKQFLVALLWLSGINTMAQDRSTPSPDSVQKNIELPATSVSSYRVRLSDENFNRKLQGSFLKRQTNAQDLPYVLGTMAGVVVSSDAGTGTGYTDIKVRGTDLTRINVTMNGVPVNDPESQATYFVNTPDLLSSTTSVELQKGVGNSKNGSSNFGAAISIQTIDFTKSTAGISYGVEYGSFNTIRNTLKLNTGLLDNKFQMVARLSSIQSDGYIQRSSSALKAAQLSARYLVNAHTKLTFNYLKGKEKTGQAWNGVLEDSLASNRTYNELGIKSDGTYYNNQTDNYGQDYYQLFMDHQMNAHWNLGVTYFFTRGKGYYEEYKTSQNFSSYGLTSPVIGNDTIENTDLIRQLWLDNGFTGGRLYVNYLSTNLDAGLYLNYNYYSGKHYGDVIWSQYGIDHGYRWYQLHANKQDLNVYAMMEYKLSPALKFFADAQIRNVNYNLYGFRNNPQLDHQLHYLFFSPKARLSWSNQHHQFSLSSGLAQKEPNRDDIEAGATALPKPEKLWDTELQYTYHNKEKWALYLTCFNMQYQDQLVLTGKINDVGAYTRTNIATSYRRGIEIEGVYRANSWFELRGNLSLSSNKLLDFTEYVDDYDQGVQVENKFSKTDISFSPSVIASDVLSFHPFISFTHSKFQKTSLDLLTKYVGEQYLDNTSNAQRKIGAYQTLDILLNCPFKFKNESTIAMKVGVYNVLNESYEARGYTYSYRYNGQLSTFNYYYPQAGRRFMLGVQVDL